MPIVTIQQFAGRTPKQKQDLARRIAEAVRIVYGKTAQPVQVLYTDMELDDWYSEGVPVRSLPREYGVVRADTE
jgi:4-oxalocrotonate tautomerase family enzyme